MAARNRVGIGLSYRPASVGIFELSVGARHQVGIRFSYRPARLQRLAESIQATQPGGTGSLKSILGLMKSLKIGGSVR